MSDYLLPAIDGVLFITICTHEDRTILKKNKTKLEYLKYTQNGMN